MWFLFLLLLSFSFNSDILESIVFYHCNVITVIINSVITNISSINCTISYYWCKSSVFNSLKWYLQLLLWLNRLYSTANVPAMETCFTQSHKHNTEPQRAARKGTSDKQAAPQRGRNKPYQRLITKQEDFICNQTCNTLLSVYRKLTGELNSRKQLHGCSEG